MNLLNADLPSLWRRGRRWNPSYAAYRFGRWQAFRRWHSMNESQGFIIRPAIEHMVVEHCNLACKGCNKASAELPASYSSLERFTSDLNALKAVLRVGTFKLTGGEPLLHPHLASFAKALKDSGITKIVELWTNGLLLHKAKGELLENIDVIRISRYPGVNIRIDKPQMAEMSKRFGLRFEIIHRPTFVEMDREVACRDAVENEEVFRTCKLVHVWSCHSMQESHYFKCPRAHILRLRDRHGLAEDGVPLHAPGLRERLGAYLADRRPLPACAWCLGSSGHSFAHRQLSRPERAEYAKRWTSSA